MKFDSVITDLQRLSVAVRSMLRFRGATSISNAGELTPPAAPADLAAWYSAAASNAAISIETNPRRRVRWAITFQKA